MLYFSQHRPPRPLTQCNGTIRAEADFKYTSKIIWVKYIAMRCDEEELELWYRLRAVKEFVASIGKREQNVAGSLICSSLWASERQSWGIFKRHYSFRRWKKSQGAMEGSCKTTSRYFSPLEYEGRRKKQERKSFWRVKVSTQRRNRLFLESKEHQFDNDLESVTHLAKSSFHTFSSLFSRTLVHPGIFIERKRNGMRDSGMKSVC